MYCNQKPNKKTCGPTLAREPIIADLCYKFDQISCSGKCYTWKTVRRRRLQRARTLELLEPEIQLFQIDETVAGSGIIGKRQRGKRTIGTPASRRFQRDRFGFERIGRIGDGRGRRQSPQRTRRRTCRRQVVDPGQIHDYG